MNFTQAEQDIKPVRRINLWNNGYVESWDFSRANSSEAHRIYAVTTIANVCRGDKGIKDRELLYQQLLTEHAGKPGEVFQFVPVQDYVVGSDSNRCSAVKRFGFMLEKDLFASLYLTNERAMRTDMKLVDNPIVSGFHVFKMKIPKMIVAHLLKHGQLSFMQQSERHCKLREYYYCDELKPILEEKLCGFHPFTRNQAMEFWNEYVYKMPQSDFDNYQHYYKIRQELTNKGSWGLGYTTLWMAGWIQDPSQWQNFFDVRLGKGTQRETRELAEAMKKLMEE